MLKAISSPVQSTGVDSGSLTPTFVPARRVCLTVKLAYAYALPIRFPSVPSQPLNASDTLLEATAPVKLPIRHCSRPCTNFRLLFAL